MTSAYLDSDSDSNHSRLSESSDVDLPACNVTSPAKTVRADEGSRPNEGTSTCGLPASEQPPFTPTPKTSFRTPDAKRRSLSLPTSTPPIYRYGVSTSTPPIYRHEVSSPVFGSPAGISPLRLVERHDKTLKQQDKLMKRVEKLTAGIKNRTETNCKLEQFLSSGGIRGMSIKELSSSPEGDDTREMEFTSEFLQKRHQSSMSSISDQFPLPLSPPGRSVMVHPPSLITELYPPGFHDIEGGGPFDNLEKNMMMEQNPDVLRELVYGGWFLLCYRTKPCPTVIWQWLFQIMCRSCDLNLASRACNVLSTLVLRASPGSNVFVPTPRYVIDVLVDLGADRNQLERKDDQGLVMEADDVFQPSLTTPLTHLSNLFKYISIAVRANPSALTCHELHLLISITAIISLDPSFTENCLYLISLSESFSSLVTAISDTLWSSSASYLSSQLTHLSSHHHDLLYLSKLIMATNQRLKTLQKMFCREAIWKVLFQSEESLKDLPDWSFVKRVVKHYYSQPAAQFEYYSMYSVMCLLNQLIHLSPLEWPSAAERWEFRKMLGILASTKIKDHPEETKRAPVKDLIMSMYLEMDIQRSKDLIQSDLFSVLGSTH